MKRGLIAALLAVLVLGAAVFEFIYVGSQSDAFTARVEAIDQLVAERRMDEALPLCRAVERDWDSEVVKIHTLLIHDYADSVGSCFSKMRAHLENNNLDMYASESADAKKGLASIKGSEYPFLENIL